MPPVGVLLVGLSALVPASPACRPAARQQVSLSEVDRAAIGALAAAHLEAVLSRDADSVAALYTEDGVLMPPNRPMVGGRAAIRATLETAPETFMDRVSFWGLRSGPDGFGFSDGFVYDWGTY